ncbi:hypothetical protein EVAR_82267_1 [Eumeta japonica]|uniref:Uncharacterized protein n=1 Tax=Eumeta variegata TaxID=151549 RepID=A0A4C1W1A2_EUMVA|nr:hypothetical protein EVAR_82267_1 [Eumeta japonica]
MSSHALLMIRLNRAIERVVPRHDRRVGRETGAVGASRAADSKIQFYGHSSGKFSLLQGRLGCSIISTLLLHSVAIGRQQPTGARLGVVLVTRYRPSPSRLAGSGSVRTERGFGRKKLVGSEGAGMCGIGPQILATSAYESELAELDIKYNDLTDQRDLLPMLVNVLNDCREHYEHSLLQIQSLQAELHSNRMETDKLQYEMDMHKVDETVKLCDSILNEKSQVVRVTAAREHLEALLECGDLRI